MAVCNKCRENQSLDKFYWRHYLERSTVQSICKKCIYERHKTWIELNSHENKKYKASYYIKNKKRIVDVKKEQYKQNKDKILSYCREYYTKNSSKIKQRSKVYREKNKTKINTYFKNRRAADIQFKISQNLRNRFGKLFRCSKRPGSAVKDLGCSIEQLKQHLESKFQPGMTWDNYGLYGWHVDHIVALAKFDLTDQQQFLKACHYTNLQPLWAEDNIKKWCR